MNQRYAKKKKKSQAKNKGFSWVSTWSSSRIPINGSRGNRRKPFQNSIHGHLAVSVMDFHGSTKSSQLYHKHQVFSKKVYRLQTNLLLRAFFLIFRPPEARSLSLSLSLYRGPNHTTCKSEEEDKSQKDNKMELWTVQIKYWGWKFLCWTGPFFVNCIRAFLHLLFFSLQLRCDNHWGQHINGNIWKNSLMYH